MLENLATATPAQIDTELARLQGLDMAAENGFRAVSKKLETYDAGDDFYREYVTKTLKQTREDMVAARAAFLETRATVAVEMAPLEAEYAARRWARYFRVDNTNGHVHTSTACRETRRTTQFGWLPEVSGYAPEQIVELSGELTCLTCFPSVRAEILAGRPCRLETKNQRATREEREAKAVAKAAKFAKTGILAPDGTPLYLKGARAEVKTIVAAERRYVEIAAWNRVHTTRVERLNLIRQSGQGINEPSFQSDVLDMERTREDMKTLLSALAHRFGTTEEEQAERFAKKIEKKFANDLKYYV